jgi:hypothetical protein
MLASALIGNGPRYLEQLLGEVSYWLEEKGFTGVEHMKGIVSQRFATSLAADERRNYIASVTSLARGATPDELKAPVDLARFGQRKTC